ncbi:RHS repeat-associated core domain-containing protein [Pseudomonas sp. NPDC012596]|uniref:RHS repeat-associated core domain-containing protein n=1 Tax=Pseudomonas sp. NPDC012596 TaxID=3364419 RepID=UPI00368432C2
MSPFKSSYFFYKNDHGLCSVIDDERAVTIISVPGISLAEQRTDPQLSEIQCLATDQQSSTLYIQHRNNEHRLSYTAYGHSDSVINALSRLGFAGQRHDGLTNCYLLGNGYRAFSPVIMRFLSPDSFSPFGRGNINSYAYCSGDPVNMVDPSGHTGGMFSKAVAFFSRKKSSKTLSNKEGHVLVENAREQKIKTETHEFYTINDEPINDPAELIARAKIATRAINELHQFPGWYSQPDVDASNLQAAASLIAIKANLTLNTTDPTGFMNKGFYQMLRETAFADKVDALASEIRKKYPEGSPTPSRKSSLASLISTTTQEFFID